MEKKMTKVQAYAEIRKVLENSEVEAQDELLAFVDAQVEQLEKKAAKAKERAAEKKSVGDELRDKVEAVLTDEFQFIGDIVEQIEDVEELTNAKVSARLTQLVNAGKAEKEQIKNDAGKKHMAYRLVVNAD